MDHNSQSAIYLYMYRYFDVQMCVSICFKIFILRKINKKLATKVKSTVLKAVKSKKYPVKNGQVVIFFIYIIQLKLLGSNRVT